MQNLMKEISGEQPWVKLYDGPDMPGDPVVKGQIVKPTEASISAFQSTYRGVLDEFCEKSPSLRVLEIGAGMGNCSYGFIRTYTPDLYIATEPFTALLPTLRDNLDEWGYHFPRGVSAAFDGNYPSILPPKSVNVVIGNSVLHHVTNWQLLLDHTIDILEDESILVFGEPNHESWSFIVTLIKAMKLATPLSEQTANRLSAFIQGIEFRFRNKNNSEVLSRLEDKHLFSMKELTDFARSRNLVLNLSRRKVKFVDSFCSKIASCIMSEKDRDLVREFASAVLDEHISGSVLGDPFLVFSLEKRC